MTAQEYAAAFRRVADTLAILAPRVLARVWIGLDAAMFCPECEAIYQKGEPACPACGSDNRTALLAFLAP